MSQRVFTSAVLLLLVMMCCEVGGARAAEGNVRDTVAALMGLKRNSLTTGRIFLTLVLNMACFVVPVLLRCRVLYLLLLKSITRIGVTAATPALLGLRHGTLI
ncbi:trans-sialidase [Trypanosoma cruzi]|nr:trans-sialidase [Trypanosoma cruzi]